MNNKHRRNIKRLAKKFCISFDESIEKFYSNEKIDKNIIFSLKKKRNKGANSGMNKAQLIKNRALNLEKRSKFIRDEKIKNMSSRADEVIRSNSID